MQIPELKGHCQPAKLITCVMQRGHGESVVQALYEQKHILGIDYSTGRNQHNKMSDGEWQEVDMILVVVSPEYADEVFSELFYLAKIYETEGGMMFQTDLTHSTNYILPDLTETVEAEVSLEKDVPESVKIEQN